MVNVGIVVKELIDEKKGIVGYRINEAYSPEFLRAIAGWSLYISNQYPFSLGEL